MQFRAVKFQHAITSGGIGDDSILQLLSSREHTRSRGVRRQVHIHFDHASFERQANLLQTFQPHDSMSPTLGEYFVAQYGTARVLGQISVRFVHFFWRVSVEFRVSAIQKYGFPYSSLSP